MADLVSQNLVHGWDDPRMPTLSGVRRRGFPARAIRLFWERAGISKQNSVIDVAVLEGCVREVLDQSALRRMAVLRPLKLRLTNLATDHHETVQIANHPKNVEAGERAVALTSEIFIEQDDFMEVPIKGFHRLVPGGEVRLRGVGIIKCESLEKDAAGKVIMINASLDLASRHGMPGAERKVKGTIHWVSAQQHRVAEVRLYDRLFSSSDPDRNSDGLEIDYRENINPASEEILTNAVLESCLGEAVAEQTFQFERLGYFTTDRIAHLQGAPVFNRVVNLRDTWAK